MTIRKFLEIPAAGTVLVAAPCVGTAELGFVDRQTLGACAGAGLFGAHRGPIADPDRAQAIADAGRRLIVDSDYRKKRSQDALLFNARHSNAAKAAQRLVMIARGEAPTEWFFDPKDVRYVHGVGGMEDKIRGLIADYVAANGDAYLFLDDKTELKAAILAFASPRQQPQRPEGRP
jgi:hypothetical protein